MSHHREKRPAVDVQSLIQDMQNTVWGILESHGIEIPDKESWAKNIPAGARKDED